MGDPGGTAEPGSEVAVDAVAVAAREESALLQALQREPENPEHLLRLGVLRLQQGNPTAARDALLHAHVLRPDSVAVRIHAARALSECRDYRAPQLIADWRQWLPLPDQQQYDLADAMQRTDWTSEAIDVLEDLLQRTPTHRWAGPMLAALYERVNRLDDADHAVDAMLAGGRPDDAEVRCDLLHLKASLLARRGEDAPAYAMLQQAGPRFADDAEHHFLLGRIADRLGDADATMAHLRDAHAIQRRELERAAPQRLAPGASLLPMTASVLQADDVARWPTLLAPDAAQSPVFVVGFPRSGTTLLEQMLDAHPALQAIEERPHFDILADQLEDYGVKVPGDLHKLTQADCDELRKGYLLMACARVQRRWDARLVDKNPLNMVWLPLICRMFPHARFILMLRHPCDVLVSNYMQNYRSAVLMAASLDLQRLAHAHVEAFTHWFHHVALLQPEVLSLRYEDLVADPDGAVQRIGSFLELGNAAMMRGSHQHARARGFIGTPSYSEVIKPIHTQGIGRWQRYRAWLGGEPLETLQPMLARLHYAAGRPA